jgi:hypothetical protein
MALREPESSCATGSKHLEVPTRELQVIDGDMLDRTNLSGSQVEMAGRRQSSWIPEFCQSKANTADYLESTLNCVQPIICLFFHF